MSRRPSLDQEQAEKLYEEYLLFLSLHPKKLMAKHGISRSTFGRYIRERLRRAA